MFVDIQSIVEIYMCVHISKVTAFNEPFDSFNWKLKLVQSIFPPRTFDFQRNNISETLSLRRLFSRHTA